MRGVSFVAHEGEAIGLLGRNGSGKSTLLRVMTGLHPATKGAVYAQGQPTLLGVGAALIPELSGARNIRLGGLALGLTHKEIDEGYRRHRRVLRARRVHQQPAVDVLVRHGRLG